MRRVNWSHALTLVPLCMLLLSACAPESDEQQGSLEINGTYTDEWGTTHVISDTQWSTSNSFGSALYHVIYYLNGADMLIARNVAGNSDNPNRYSQFDWTRFSGDLYYCQHVYDAETIAGAETGAADPSNPPAGGCGASNFPWTNLTP